MIVLDTNDVSLLQHERGRAREEILRLLNADGRPVATTIITIDEQCRGWLAGVRRMKNIRRQIPPYDSLRRLIEFFAGWTILAWDFAACDRFDILKKERLRIGTMDLKISAITIVNGCIFLSRNLGDFARVPDLDV